MVRWVDWLGRNWSWGIATATAVAAIAANIARPGFAEWAANNMDAISAWGAAMMAWISAALRAHKMGQVIPDAPDVELPKVEEKP